MPTVKRGSIELYYEAHGDAGRPTILLLHGLGDQITRWPQAFVDGLIDDGYRVVMLDNRDSGWSTKLSAHEAPHPIAIVQAVVQGEPLEVPYTLDDMADDAAAVLAALDIDAAHVLGMSMGGMIAQTFALRHRARTKSLVSLMSTTGRLDIALPRLDLIDELLRPGEASVEAAIEQGVAFRRLVQGSKIAMSDDEMRREVERQARRDYTPEALGRQFAALLAAGDARRAALASLVVPVLVIHGDEDPLVPPDGGRDTHDAIPGSRLVMIEGLGHDLPAAFIPTLTELVRGHVRAAEGSSTAR